MLQFNTDGMVVPSFPFPASIMNYIFENLQPQHLIKLYQCSKWFYFKYNQNIIQHLEIVDDGEPESFDFTKTIVCTSNPVLKELANFWITDSLIDRSPIGFVHSFTNCTIMKLELCGNILWKNFELLTKAGNIEDIKIVGIFGEHYYASVDEIFAKVPKATSIEIYKGIYIFLYFRISESHFTPTTCTSLLSLDHKVKISNLVLKNLTSAHFIEIQLFIDFLLKNTDDQCNVCIDFEKIPEVNDLSRDFNAILVELEDNYRRMIANKLKEKQLKKQNAAVL